MIVTAMSIQILGPVTCAIHSRELGILHVGALEHIYGIADLHGTAA